VAHVEPRMEDEQTPLGPIIEVEQIDVQATSSEVVFADICRQEVLEIDNVVLQEASRRQELDMVVHPSLGLPIEEVQTNIVAASKAAIYSGSNPLQEFIDRACNIVCPLFPIRGRKAGFLEHVLIVQVEHQELSMDQYRHSKCIPCTGIHALDW